MRIGDWKYTFIDQPDGWPGGHVKLNMPTITNLRRDPFERYQDTNWAVGSSDYMMSFYAREFWRFVFVQQQVATLAQTAFDFPPMQKGASFNLDAVKAQVDEAMKAQTRKIRKLVGPGHSPSSGPPAGAPPSHQSETTSAFLIPSRSRHDGKVASQKITTPRPSS